MDNDRYFPGDALRNVRHLFIVRLLGGIEMNMKKQSGFTLIELVMVIVILGILAATFAPKFVDISSDAVAAANAGAIAGVKSAHTILIAQKKGKMPTLTELALNTDGATEVATGVAFDADNDSSTGTLGNELIVLTLSPSTAPDCSSTVATTASTSQLICGFQ